MNEVTPRVPLPRSPVGADEVPGQREHLVVGVDGSAASVHALAWAMKYAADTHGSLEIVTAWPVHSAAFVGEVPGHFSEERWKAAEIQAQAIAHALSLVEDAPHYISRLENAAAVDALARASKAADLLVLGSDRYDEADARPAVDSTAVVLLTVDVQDQARCPVILVPYRPTRDALAAQVAELSATVPKSS